MMKGEMAMHGMRRWYPVDWIRLGFLLVFTVLVAALIYARFTVPAAPYGGPPHGWWFPFGGLWLLFAAILFLGLMRRALWGLPGWRRGFGGGGYGHGWHPRGDEAFHILRQRFARGEITKDQYDAMRRALREPPEAPRGS